MQYPTIASRREVAGADGSSSVRVMAKCRFPGMPTIRRFFDQPPKAKGQPGWSRSFQSIT